MLFIGEFTNQIACLESCRKDMCDGNITGFDIVPFFTKHHGLYYKVFVEKDFLDEKISLIP
jgi:hypothetical protein